MTATIWPLLPGCTALLVARLRPTKVVLTVRMAGVLLWGTIEVTGTIDQFRYHQTVVEAHNWLLHHGVAATPCLITFSICCQRYRCRPQTGSITMIYQALLSARRVS
jgi:hypothetical protein